MARSKPTVKEVDKTIKQLKRMLKAVEKLNRIYDNGEMNTIQPPAMGDCLKYSLDEWPHSIRQAIHQWEGVKVDPTKTAN